MRTWTCGKFSVALRPFFVATLHIIPPGEGKPKTCVIALVDSEVIYGLVYLSFGERRTQFAMSGMSFLLTRAIWYVQPRCRIES